MTNLRDVLKASKGLPVRDPIAEIWGRGLQGGGYTVIEYTGTLPITITADGNALLDYQIFGNTEQTGTPTPENPIMPEGVGELETAGTHAGQYKLPILSNSTVTNIYLGEAETTRRIKKFVLTGNESYGKDSGGEYMFWMSVAAMNVQRSDCFCSHLESTRDYPRNQKGCCSYKSNMSFYLNFGADIMNRQPRGNTVTGIKEYIASQYAAGTPVTIWLVLEEPETVVVNEPLMKIGDYADTIDSTQATVQIPTFAGTTVIDCDGELKPSQMYIKYRRRNAVGEVESTLPITITADGSALLDYRVYGAEGGVGEARRSENLISYDDFGLVDIGDGTYRYGVDMGVLPKREYEISWGSLDPSVGLLLTILYPNGNRESIGLTTPYRFIADGTSTYVLRTNKATDTPPIDQLVNGLSVVRINYAIRLKINSDTVTLSLKQPLMSDEYADFGDQAAYHKSVPDDVRLRFEQENQVTFADPEAVVSSGGNRVRTVVTAVLGEGYTCKEIGTVYSNTDGLCENDDLFVYRVDGLTVKKASYTDGRTARSSNTLDSGFGVKTVGFATISDGTYTTTIYTRILYATYERLHDLGDFTAYPPNTGQNFVPTAVTLPEIPTSEGVTIINCDMTPKPEKMYVRFRR